MKKRNFQFNLNRCTGCGACVVACRIENDRRQGVNWREVYTFNEPRHPDAPSFFLSLACNHCEVPACMNNCPALAISRDEKTGIVEVDDRKCIGCKYCTWACPYDAPRYNPQKGHVEKCDFCKERMQNGEAPACVCACPTNALRIEETDVEEDRGETGGSRKTVDGFPLSRLEPSIRFLPLREKQIKPELTAPPGREVIDAMFQASLEKPMPKITLASEWALLIFTSVAYILVSIFASILWHGRTIVNPVLFFVTGVAVMGLSAVHLGRKGRAFRAIFNLKSSWLSREIFLFSAFLGLTGFYFLARHLMWFQGKPLNVVGWTAALIGFLMLFAIDRLYQLALHTGPVNFHSAHTFLNAFYLTGLLIGNIPVVILFGVFKLGLYLYRKYLVRKQKRNPKRLISLIRVILGFIVPLAYAVIKTGFQFSTNFSVYGILIICVVAGDLIDRAEYYEEIDVITPRKQMLIDLERVLKR